MPRRRRFLVLSGTAVSIALTGCADNEAEFLVVDYQQVPQGDNLRYVVTIENTGPSREEGRLEMTLTYNPDGESESWSKTDNISLGRGASVQESYLFEGVLPEGRLPADYSFEAELRQE